MKKIFVTGITGLLGSNLVSDLLGKGYKVKGLVRDKTAYAGPSHPNLELVEGTLFDDFTRLLEEMDIVIHAAAETRQNLLHYSEYWRINCNTTIQLFSSAVYCKVKTFVFVSTANTLGYGTESEPGDETGKIRYPFSRLAYAKSKLEAEEYLLKNNRDINVLIVHPGFMLGPMVSRPGSGRIVRMGWKKRIIFYPPGGKSFVHVKDVSVAICTLIEKGKNGNKYLIVNENLSYSGFFTKLNRITHQTPVMVRIPVPIMRMIGCGGDFLRLLGVKSSLSSVNMKILCVSNFYSNKKSVSELNIEYRSIDQAIRDSIDIFTNRALTEKWNKP